MDKKLNAVIGQMLNAVKSHDESMAVLVVKALKLCTQAELVKHLGDKGFKTSQTQISRWNSIGKALQAGTITPEQATQAGKNLRQNKAKVSDVAEGKTTRKPAGKTDQVTKFDSVKRNLKLAVKDSKTLTSAEKSKLRDLALELVTILEIIPSVATLDLEFDAIMAEIG
jgi:phage gp37-like protein